MSPKHSYSVSFENEIIKFIEKYPFLSLREIARELNTSAQLLKYHIDILLTNGRLKSKKDGKYVRFFTPSLNFEEYEKNLITIIRKPKLLKVIMVFLNHQKKNKGKILKNSELIDYLDISTAGTVTYYTNQLINAEILVKSNEGFSLKNPIFIENLIKKYQPPPTIIDNFISIWFEFFS